MRRKLEGKAYVEQYLQSLTHEMKSPLAAIRGAAELLQEPLPEAERQRFVRNIAEQQQRLTETIDKLLALAEVEQHGWLQGHERVALAPLFAQLAEALAPQLRASGVQLQVHTPDAELALAGDPYLLRQALHNLLDNAIAFSPAGGTVVLRAERAAHARIALLVEDAGSGVPAYALQRVFEHFYSLPRPATGQRSSGLGLSFVREVARLHGGEASLRNARERRRAGAPGAWLKTAQCRRAGTALCLSEVAAARRARRSSAASRRSPPLPRPWPPPTRRAWRSPCRPSPCPSCSRSAGLLRRNRGR
ncbi:sensory histidine kinase CreC [Xanthomonas translucens pv. phlei]|uniref:histidine kinase n=1 Tax=Xanthomonas graminis pv. phlei TaxID=487906 RepID=A0A0K2ZW86_9XANT|nr:sensory histidine kinase CreC [Xanthomonas translucens pv. phlei]